MRWFLIVLVACSHHDEPPPPPPAPPPPVQHLSSDFGSCELVIGSDHEKVAPTSRAVAYPPLAINCIGKLGRMTFEPAPGAAVPFGPHTYKIERGTRDYVVFARARDKQLANIEGTIDVTAFDATHIAGTFDLAGTAGAQRVTLSGTFDFPCRGGCGK